MTSTPSRNSRLEREICGRGVETSQGQAAPGPPRASSQKTVLIGNWYLTVSFSENQVTQFIALEWPRIGVHHCLQDFRKWLLISSLYVKDSDIQRGRVEPKVTLKT